MTAGQKGNLCMVCGGVLRAEDGHFHTRQAEEICCECAGCDGEIALGSARTEVFPAISFEDILPIR